MEINQFYYLFKQKKGALTVVLLLFLVVGAVLTVIQPFKYESKSELLIIKEMNAAVDPYTAAKSNEFLSNIFARVITSNSFFDEVKKSGAGIDFNYFPERADKKMKLWHETISAMAQGDSGIISVSVFHSDQNQAKLISDAINNVLITKNSLYHGEGDKVKIKVINEPVVSRWPVKPNLFLIFSLSLVFGFIFFVCYIILYPHRLDYDRMWQENHNIKNNAEAQPIKKNMLLESVLAPDENLEINNVSARGGSAFGGKNFSEAVNHNSAIPAAREVKSIEVSVQEQPKTASTPAIDESGNNELTYDDIVKRGNIGNIFGNQDLDE